MATDPTDGVDKGATEIDDQPFIKASSEARRLYGRFNLAIVGGTGVGKSSLVNAVFGRDRAKVGKGLPVTKGVNYYHDPSLGIWDFEGFEIGSTSPAETIRSGLETISQRPDDEQIAVVWYCVLASADRLTQTDIDLIRELDAAGLPVILVMTKVPGRRTRSPASSRRRRTRKSFANGSKIPRTRTGARSNFRSGASSLPQRKEGVRARGSVTSWLRLSHFRRKTRRIPFALRRG